MPDRFPPISKDFRHLLHGGDYNPEQWPAEVWDEDQLLLKLAGCNTVSIGIFSWAKLEPAEGQFDFGWMDAIFEKCAANGVRVILATPGGARPAWMAFKYPEVLRVDEYRRLRDEIDRLVGRINGDYGRIGRPAISYMHSSYPREEMAALYRAADIMVVTPLRDGMNLVAKEYVACRHRDDGALVLSEFAGAADELKQAYMVNPYDINGMKAAILEAMNAPKRELTKRMKAMRKTVRSHDVSDWAEEFMGTLRQARPDHRKRLRPSKLLA